MNPQQLLITLANPFVGFVLRSPLHGLFSANTMLVSVRGRVSGRAITTPVNYVRRGNELLVVSQAGRTWWRNLRGGGRVTCLVEGREMGGTARVSEDAAAVGDGLAVIAAVSPAYARFLGLESAVDGISERSLLEQAAAGRVLVHVTLD